MSETAYSHKQWKPQMCLQVCHHIYFEACALSLLPSKYCDSSKQNTYINTTKIFFGWLLFCVGFERKLAVVVPPVLKKDTFDSFQPLEACQIDELCTLASLFYAVFLPTLANSQPSFFPCSAIPPDHVRPRSQPHMYKFWDAKLSFISVVMTTEDNRWDSRRNWLPQGYVLSAVGKRWDVGMGKQFSSYQMIFCVFYSLQLCLCFCANLSD